MPDDLRPPYRIQFDNARDPYSARNALGIMGSGGGFITSVSSPLSVSGGNLTIDLSGYAPVNAEYITAATNAALTSERVLTNTATITWDFSTAGQAKANATGGGGNVSNSGTPTAGQSAEWVTATTIKGITPVYPSTTTKGAGSGTYTVPAGVKWLRVRMTGGGGGGSGSGTGGSAAGGTGGTTTFGSSFLTCGGGAGSSFGSGGAGGSASGGNINVTGAKGSDTVNGLALGPASSGGSTAFGGAGGGGGFGGSGSAAYGGTGSGGGGGGPGSTFGGSAGGGAGGYLEIIIVAPAASYAYAVGAAGTGGAAGTSGFAGGGGGSGIIFIEEYYGP